MENTLRKKEKTLQDYLKKGNIAFFGYKPKVLPDFVYQNREGRTRFFLKNKEKNTLEKTNTHVSRYCSLSEMRDELADVYFLDHEATKVLFADFPAASHYVLIRLMPRMSWIAAIPGLIRRLFIGLVKIEGVIKLKEGNKSGKWLVLRHELRESLNTRLCLSSDVGIQRFLDYLRNEKIKHVVLRFYEKLPELNREGGDLDILVTDEDDHKIRDFLQENPGPIGIDVWTVSRTKYNDITYYPPPIARRIIDSAVDGPAGSKIPAPKEAFLSFAYHVVYHKGLFAGVQTSMPGVVVNEHPDNDYAGFLVRMAKDLGIDIKITLESLDEYLEKEGWRPKLDTLAKIAPRNKWVWKRFFSGEPSEEIGLGVFIIKKKAFELGVTGFILKEISGHEGFRVLRTKKLNEDEVMDIANSLRGGVWSDKSDGNNDFLPAMAVLVLDTNITKSHKMNIPHHSNDKGIVILKKKVLRRKFDNGKVSLIHSTDNTSEAWEYIPVCFKEELEDVKKEISKARNEIHLSFMDKLNLRISLIPRYLTYKFVLFKQDVKKRIVRWAVG